MNDRLRKLVLQHLDLDCEVEGCCEESEFEGWYEQLDFTGNKTGLMQRRRVCCEHVKLLIGYKNYVASQEMSGCLGDGI